MRTQIEAFYSDALVGFEDRERDEFLRLLNKLKVTFSAMEGDN